MDEGTAILQAVIAEPRDDLPRLALADWLEEHGDEERRARSAFIRAQVRLASEWPLDEDPPYGSPEWRLWDACQRLLNRPSAPGGYYDLDTLWRRDEWRQLRLLTPGYSVADADYPPWRRGWFDDLKLSWHVWQRQGFEFTSAWPLTRVTLTGDPPAPAWHDDLIARCAFAEVHFPCPGGEKMWRYAVPRRDLEDGRVIRKLVERRLLETALRDGWPHVRFVWGAGK